MVNVNLKTVNVEFVDVIVEREGVNRRNKRALRAVNAIYAREAGMPPFIT